MLTPRPGIRVPLTAAVTVTRRGGTAARAAQIPCLVRRHGPPGRRPARPRGRHPGGGQPVARTTAASCSPRARPPATPTPSLGRPPRCSPTATSATCASPPPRPSPRGARRDRDRARRRTGRHPAGVRPGAGQHARVPPGDRLMAATSGEDEEPGARTRLGSRPNPPTDPAAEAAIGVALRRQGDAADPWVPSPARRAGRCRVRRARRGSGSAGPTPAATSAAAPTGMARACRAVRSGACMAPAASSSRLEARLCQVEAPASIYRRREPVGSRFTGGPARCRRWPSRRMAAPSDAAEIDRGALERPRCPPPRRRLAAIVEDDRHRSRPELLRGHRQRTAADSSPRRDLARCEAGDAARPVGRRYAAARRVRDVFGGSLWRAAGDARWREVGIDARLGARSSAGPWWALDGLAIVSERPSGSASTTGAGRTAPTGRPSPGRTAPSVWAWHGVPVEPWIDHRAPGRSPSTRSTARPNIEVRRVLIERFGEERLVREGGAELVARGRDGPAVAPAIRSASLVAPRGAGRHGRGPELDPGARRLAQDLLPAGPAGRCATAREAVAWTFGLLVRHVRGPRSET